jgi:SAM-dependent methyltransferase
MMTQAEKNAKLLAPWQAKVITRWPSFENPPQCPECNQGTFIEVGGASSSEAYHPNIDIREMSGVDIVANLNKDKLPFHDNHAKRIKSIQSINHLTAEGAKHLLQECYRVLRKDGTLYIMVTDIEFCMKRIAEDGFEDVWMTCLYGTRGDTYTDDFHYWGYSTRSLEMLLREVGFKDVQFAGRFNMWEFRMEAKKSNIIGLE